MGSALLNALQTKDAKTHNGAVTNSTSLNPLVDLFFIAGACRKETQHNIELKLMASYVYDRVKTLKLIYWAGDIRHGTGERRFFKIALLWLNKTYPQELTPELIAFIPEVSRWDILFELTNNEDVFGYIINQFIKEENKLLFKWLPRKKQYNNLAARICKFINMKHEQYRKILVKNTKVVEQEMCANKWGSINYEQVPSIAAHNYQKAFSKHDGDRYGKYLESVKKGDKKINAGAIFPHQIIKNALVGYSAGTLSATDIAQWEALPDYLEGTTHSILPMCDVSGSMYSNNNDPIAMSIALGLYLSEKNNGPFKDAFMTFSGNPKLNYLKGTINQKIKQLSKADWAMNTDVNKAFRFILQRAVEEKVPQEDMPTTVLIISDMEFDSCGGRHTNFEMIEKEYIAAGYERPNLVFWNVNGRSGNVPVTINKQGVGLVSGASPSVVKAVLTGQINPLDIVLNTIEVERYNIIK